MNCKYCEDEFCVNDECPERADYCPYDDEQENCEYSEEYEDD